MSEALSIEEVHRSVQDNEEEVSNSPFIQEENQWKEKRHQD